MKPKTGELLKPIESLPIHELMINIERERVELFRSIELLSAQLGEMLKIEDAWKETLAVTGFDTKSYDLKEVQRILLHLYQVITSTRARLGEVRKQFSDLTDTQRELSNLRTVGVLGVGEA